MESASVSFKWWIDDVVYIQNEIFLGFKKNGIVQLSGKWMELEELCEQDNPERQTNTTCSQSYVEPTLET